MELEALQDILPEITAVGATLVAISPQRVEYLRQMKQQHGIRFDLLRDVENVVAGQFGLAYSFPASLRQLYEAVRIDLERFTGEESRTVRGTFFSYSPAIKPCPCGETTAHVEHHWKP
jgi:hypothetical protein